MNVVNIFTNCADQFSMTFYLDIHREIYYVNLYDRDQYIALDDYFLFLKTARIIELQKIAQDLGAKYFKVTFKEEKQSASGQNLKGSGKGVFKGFGKVNADAEHNSAEKSHSTEEVVAEMHCVGHNPTRPTLVYFQNDQTVKGLIDMRMSDNKIESQTLTIKCSSSSGIKEKDAVKINAALQAMKCGGGVALVREARSEERRVFKYEIEF